MGKICLNFYVTTYTEIEFNELNLIEFNTIPSCIILFHFKDFPLASSVRLLVPNPLRSPLY